MENDRTGISQSLAIIQNVGFRPATSTLPGDLVEVQDFRPQPRPAESDYIFTKATRRGLGYTFKFEEHYPKSPTCAPRTHDWVSLSPKILAKREPCNQFQGVGWGTGFHWLRLPRPSWCSPRGCTCRAVASLGSFLTQTPSPHQPPPHLPPCF